MTALVEQQSYDLMGYVEAGHQRETHGCSGRRIVGHENKGDIMIEIVVRIRISL